MLAWMGYTVAVTLLLSGAAFAAERAARLRRIASRSIWAGAIIASLALPMAISMVTIKVPGVLLAADQGRVIALRDMTSSTLSTAAWTAPRANRPALMGGSRGEPGFGIDVVLKRAWAFVSAILLIALAGSAIHSYWRRRFWPRTTMCGVEVHVSDDVGPAVVGLLRPRIVVPRWLASAPQRQQVLVIAHEQSHLDAGDPQLLSLALCLLVAMPWNLPLWWQMRRLRHAIEVDCDARVLGAGHDLQHYGAALIDVGARHSGFIGMAAAMAESPSLLEQRIRIMVSAPQRRGQLAAALCALPGIVHGRRRSASWAAQSRAPGDRGPGGHPGRL